MINPDVGVNLNMDRCPYCWVATPNLFARHSFETHDSTGRNQRFWRVYECGRCGGVVIASSAGHEQEADEIYPAIITIEESIPSPAKEYLQQALDSLCAPAGSIMLSASAIDSMLKEKGYKSGNLYSRIEKAAEEHLITQDMAKWAHEVRLDANEQRHADEKPELPDTKAAKRTVDFALALAQFLFVLPAKIQKGITGE